MRAVEERKKEQERRDDRKIQKEREAEGAQFADKEAYVTSAYRQKLKERQEELEREKRAAEIEGKIFLYQIIQIITKQRESFTFLTQLNLLRGKKDSVLL